MYLSLYATLHILRMTETSMYFRLYTKISPLKNGAREHITPALWAPPLQGGYLLYTLYSSFLIFHSTYPQDDENEYVVYRRSRVKPEMTVKKYHLYIPHLRSVYISFSSTTLHCGISCIQP
jgi:hypothetical protein